MIDVNSSVLSEEKPERRSRLSCGRHRSRSFSECNVATKFYRSIPMELSKEERLKQLCRMAYQYTLSSVCREFEHYKGFDATSVIDYLSKCYDDIECVLEKRNLFVLATQTPQEIEHEEDVIIKKTNEAIKTLKLECRTWIKVLQEEERKLKQCMDASDEKFQVSEDDSDELSDSNCDDVLKSAENVHNKLILASSNAVNFLSVLTKTTLTDKEVLDFAVSIASKRLSSDGCETPRTLLLNLPYRP